MTKTRLEAEPGSTGHKFSHWVRLLLLALVLTAFARVLWWLDAKNLWWDESLSLQRVESDWLPLLLGHLVMIDGFREVLTIDQHPFFFFLLQGILLRMAGNSEFVLRFVSVMSATTMVPVAWAFSRNLTSRNIFPSSSAVWSALFAAVSPFLLWYGQEARPYALLAMLALLSTYLLLRATATPATHWFWLVAYVVVELMFLTTHYFAVFLLPVHAVLLYRWIAARSRSVALITAIALLLVGAGVGALAFYWIIVRRGGGVNFSSISWSILLPDLLNAFSLGLSVDIDTVWWLDLVFGVTALTGTVWALRSRRSIENGGWLPVALIIAPLISLMVINSFQPVYMNACHLSLIAGGFLILLAGGMGLIWRYFPWLAGVLTVLMLVGTGYSTFNYFTLEEYAKDDFARLGAHLDGRLAPGDLVLVKPTFAWRIFAYYVPTATVRPLTDDADFAVLGVPMLERAWGEQYETLEALRNKHRRVWLVVSGTFPFMDLEGRIETWLDSHMYQVQEVTFFSHSSLKEYLYLPEVPVYESVPDTMGNALGAVFGDQIRLAGYDIGTTSSPHLALPVTLYWQIETPTSTHYKYLLTLVETAEDGQEHTIAITEREPYDGAIPTVFWEPGKTIVEYTELPADSLKVSDMAAEPGRFRLTLQIYDAQTLERLPVTESGGASVDTDEHVLILPYLPK